MPTEPSFWEFVTSPGAGGLAALLAATLGLIGVLLVSRHRRRDAADDRVSEARTEAIAEWWRRFEWLTGPVAQLLPPLSRSNVAAEMRKEAIRLDDPVLMAAAEVYRVELNREMAGYLANGGED